MARVDQDRTDILTGSLDSKTPLVRDPGLPAAQGLYDPSLEKDSCGVGFVAHLKGKRSHEIVRMGLRLLENLVHRGACGCDPETGDGAGILLQLPHTFLRAAAGLPDKIRSVSATTTPNSFCNASLVCA